MNDLIGVAPKLLLYSFAVRPSIKLFFLSIIAVFIFSIRIRPYKGINLFKFLSNPTKYEYKTSSVSIIDENPTNLL